MIRILGKIPADNFVVACSGGPDSMALVDFCLGGKRSFSVAHVHHGTEASEAGLEIVSRYCSGTSIELHSFRVENDPPEGRSKEEFWRSARYKFFASLDKQILMAHHLDDAVETWIFSSLNGNPNVIPYKNHKANVIRPFLLNKKEKLVSWCDRRGVPYIVDESNEDVSFARNRIRHNIVPESLKVNPGLHKVIKKRILSEFQCIS